MRSRGFARSRTSEPAPGDLAARLQQAEAELERLRAAEEDRNLFLATASHELKTPLTVIQGFAQALLDRPGWDEPTRERALAAIQARAVELSRIIDRILLSSRIDAGRAQIAVRPVPLDLIVRDRTEALRSASGRDLRAESLGGVADALADPGAFTTVLDHLLDNALKYSPEGGVVTVTVREAGERIELRVADQGIGMTPDQAARCFDRFWQADAGDGRRFGGTGIGLHIVRSLVLAMGGEVDVDSAPGRGSTFRVSLPRADRATELRAVPALLEGSAG